MKNASRVWMATSIVIIGSLLVAPTAAIALPTSFERDLKNSARTEIGKVNRLAVENCNWTNKGGRQSYKCKVQFLEVTVNSFKFIEMRDYIDQEVATYAIDLTIKNFSSMDTGIDVGSLLRCSNSRGFSNFYAEGLDPQFLSARTQESGIVIASFPDDMSPSSCLNPTLFLSVQSGAVDPKTKKVKANLKKRKLVASAYVQLSVAELTQ